MSANPLLAGKIALVTGGASGIGAAAAVLYAQAGARVVVCDVDRAGGSATVSAIENAGGEAVFVASDVSNEDDVERMVQFVVSTYGRLDCAFNNAGIIGIPSPLAEMTLDNWQRLQDVNLRSVWLCMKHEITQMLKTGGGAIVNTSSVAGFKAIPTMSHYVAAKHGVAGLTKTAAVEYAKAGIRANAICPGYIYTPMMNSFFGSMEDKAAHEAACCPMGRHGRPEEVGELAVWLSSDKASYLTGQVIAVDGGIMAG